MAHTSTKDPESQISSGLKRVTISLEPTPSVSTKDDDYKSDHGKVGIAMIFNHKEVFGQKLRTMTHCDRVEKALKSFGFDVRTFTNLSALEISTELQRVAREDHTDSDCLVIVVLSYGVEASLLAKDAAYPVESLWKPFLGSNCKSLNDKPKLIFIEACRGKEVASAASRTARPSTSAVEIQPLSIPRTGDICVFYGSFQHQFSSPKVGNGAVFVQFLCTAVEEATKSEQQGVELSNLLFTVNRKVAEKYESMSRRRKVNLTRQLPITIQNLSKNFFLRVRR